MHAIVFMAFLQWVKKQTTGRMPENELPRKRGHQRTADGGLNHTTSQAAMAASCVCD